MNLIKFTAVYLKRNDPERKKTTNRMKDNICKYLIKVQNPEYVKNFHSSATKI